MDHYKKYSKVKNKYIKLKEYESFINNHKFYITHRVMYYDNLIKILQTGIIRFGKHIDTSIYKLDDIYGNLYFDDIKNIEYPSEFMLLLHPKVMLDHSVQIDKGWGNSKLVKIKKNDGSFKKKMKKAYNWIKNPVGLPGKLDDLTEGIQKHQIIINKELDVKEYVIGIICLSGDFGKIQKILNKKYNGIKLITVNEFPDFDDLIN